MLFFLCVFEKAILTGANLSNGFFVGCDFSESNLSGANFSNSDLSSASIVDAIMLDADLSKTDLTFTELFRSNLSGTSFYKAYLFKADLSGSNLTNANFRKAQLLYTDLSNTILTGADFTDAEIEVEDTEILKWLGPENIKKVKISSHMDKKYRKLNFIFESERYCKLSSDYPTEIFPESGFIDLKHTIIVKTFIKEYAVWYTVQIKNQDIVVLEISNFYDYSNDKESGLKKNKKMIVLKTITEDKNGYPLPNLKLTIYFDKSGMVKRLNIHSYREGITTEYC